MKKISIIISLLAIVFTTTFAQETLSPYFKVGELKGDYKTAVEQVSKLLADGGFTIIGEYQPAANNKLTVICFTNDELKNLSLQFKDRGALASVLKAAIVEKEGKKTLSILNPEYMFLAYWGKQLNGQNEQLKKMSERVKNLFTALGTLQPFGGEVAAKELPDYHYMMMMPYFDEPVGLAVFDSFENGLETIRKNLDAKKGNTVKVYEQVFTKEKIAVFGIGLTSKEDGEAYFLPVIGEDNIANLPYEIILQGTTATILHGKYRIAIYWPELTMGTFMKISSTPGYIEEVMEGLVE
jgi:uncharacterized protein (DUF302 family)